MKKEDVLRKQYRLFTAIYIIISSILRMLGHAGLLSSTGFNNLFLLLQTLFLLVSIREVLILKKTKDYDIAVPAFICLLAVSSSQVF